MNDDWGGCGDNDEEATMMIGDDNGSDASLRLGRISAPLTELLWASLPGCGAV